MSVRYLYFSGEISTETPPTESKAFLSKMRGEGVGEGVKISRFFSQARNYKGFLGSMKIY